MNLNRRLKSAYICAMNFLAHSQLSGDNDDLLFGNFVADAVKGNSYNKYDDDIRKGILLHRKIDSYTDKHPIVLKSTQKVRAHFGKFAGIAVDIYYDHFLAANWPQYDASELSSFTVRVYAILARRFLILPARTRRMLPFLIAQNWLNSYANPKDLERIFYGMDRRTQFKSGMASAVDVLYAHYDTLQKDFEDYYPDLRAYVAEALRELDESNGIK